MSAADATLPCFKDASEAKRRIQKLGDLAMDDLLNAISCLQCAVESERQHLLLAASEEYLTVLIGKLKIAKSLVAVPVLGNGLPEEGA